jgi:hypothetical protein
MQTAELGGQLLSASEVSRDTCITKETQMIVDALAERKLLLSFEVIGRVVHEYPQPRRCREHRVLPSGKIFICIDTDWVTEKIHLTVSGSAKECDDLIFCLWQKADLTCNPREEVKKPQRRERRKREQKRFVPNGEMIPCGENLFLIPGTTDPSKIEERKVSNSKYTYLVLNFLRDETIDEAIAVCTGDNTPLHIYLGIQHVLNFYGQSDKVEFHVNGDVVYMRKTNSSNEQEGN